MSSSPSRLSELFTAALDLPAAERAAFLQQACGEDQALRAEVDALLAADQGPAARALEALTPLPTPPLQPGQWVAGRYRIVRVLGEGGMGIVYEAEQLQPARTVALKCMRTGLVGGQARQRFAREAELLGRLRHPGIAQILEAGTVDGDGSAPYFAMEFVRGEGLLEHGLRLPLPQRLQLFVQVGEAVEHAHAQGIVHRDLKPANVLVDLATGTPQPKVLDFGVGRALDADATLLTRTHEIVGTLAWLSPEQLAGNAAGDPRTDVWALGVLLYQLLTGRLPFELAGLSLLAAARLVQDTEPTPVAQLQPGLRGDVATIVHTCLHKDPDRRYASAGALVADLRRHLAHEPIRARPASTLYRLSRFTRRHRAVVAGLTATILALATGLGFALHFLAGERQQRARADQRATELRALARDLVFDVEDQLADVAGATAARQLVVATGLRYAERLLQDAGDDPALLREVGGAFLKLARVLGDPTRSNLGDLPGAGKAAQQAVDALQRATATAPDQDGLTRLHAALLLQAELYRAQNQPPPRLAALQRARDLAARMQELGYGDDARLAYERDAAELGRVQAEMGRCREAIANFRIYMAGQEPRAARGERTARRNLVLMHRQLGGLHARLGDGEAADRELQLAVELADGLHREQPDDATSTAVLAEGLREQAQHRAVANRPAEALALLQRARDLLAALPVEAKDVASRRRRATVDFAVADALLALGRTAEAGTVLAAYQQVVDELLAQSPQNWSRMRDAMSGRQLAIQLAAQNGDRAAAGTAYQDTLRLCTATVQGDPGSALFHEDLAQTHRHAAAAFERLAAADAAQRDECLRLAAAALAEEAATLRTMLARKFDLAWVQPRLTEVEQKLATLSPK